MSIRYAILGLLSWQPLSGYDLKKIIADSAALYWSGNNNQIYTALVALHREGLVEREIQQQESLPARKVYSITANGRGALRAWVEEVPEPPELRNAFLVQLAWADLLSPAELTALLDGYEARLRTRLLVQQEAARRARGPERTPREAYLWAMIDENILGAYEGELNWLGRLRAGLAGLDAGAT